MGFGSSAVCDIRLNTVLTTEQRAKFQDSATIRELLGQTKTIAIIGLSGEKTKASNMVASYLLDAIGAKAIWLQLRIIDLPSADRAIEAGLIAIVDKCVKMEHGRYCGALHWAGMNTEVITAQRRKLR